MKLTNNSTLNKKKNRAIVHAAYIRRVKKACKTTSGAEQHAQEVPMVFYPLISCIMPTAGRPAYVAQSVDMFLRQDYPAKELIICFNDWSDLPAIHYPPQVRLVQVKTKIIGTKRNECCRLALGAIITQWDDDDMNGSDRLSRQVAPIISGQADISGLRDIVFFEAPAARCWKADKALFAAIYAGNVHGGSLMYRREVWEKLSVYPNRSLGEDVVFLQSAAKKGARVAGVDIGNSFVYVRHNSNTCKYERDNFRRYEGWLHTKLPGWAKVYAPCYINMAEHQAQFHPDPIHPM